MFSGEIRDLFLASRNGLFFQIVFAGGASMTSFLLFLPASFSLLPAPNLFWPGLPEPLSLPSFWYPALGLGEDVFLQTPRPLSPWTAGLSPAPSCPFLGPSPALVVCQCLGRDGPGQARKRNYFCLLA